MNNRNKFTLSKHLFPVYKVLYSLIQSLQQLPCVYRIYFLPSRFFQRYPVEFQVKAAAFQMLLPKEYSLSWNLWILNFNHII